MFAHRRGVTQIVVLVEERADQRLLGCPPHLPDRDRPQIAQRGLQGFRRDLDSRRNAPPVRGDRASPLRRRKPDVASAIQSQQQPPADRIAISRQSTKITLRVCESPPNETRMK
jgi:hypothetical protein